MAEIVRRHRKLMGKGVCEDTMAIFSKELCRQRLKIWLAAEEAIATGQRYQIEGRSLTRADLYDVRKELEYWAGKLAEAESEEQSGGYIRAYHFVPRDV